MRILAVADLHGDFEAYQWVVDCVTRHEPDAVVLAGDLLAAGESYETVEEDQRQDARLIENVLTAAMCSYLYIMGNDDWIEPPFEGKQFESLHGRRIELGGYNFVGYPYSLPFMGGIYERPENQIKQDLMAIEPLLDSRTVFVTHSPAKGILDGGHGSTSLASLLRRNTVLAHMHGHSHSNFGRWENRFNAAAGYVWRAMIIDLASLEHQVLRYENQN